MVDKATERTYIARVEERGAEDMEKRETQVVRLRLEVYRLLKVEAAKRGLKMSELAAEALRFFVENGPGGGAR